MVSGSIALVALMHGEVFCGRSHTIGSEKIGGHALPGYRTHSPDTLACHAYRQRAILCVLGLDLVGLAVR